MIRHGDGCMLMLEVQLGSAAAHCESTDHGGLYSCSEFLGIRLRSGGSLPGMSHEPPTGDEL